MVSKINMVLTMDGDSDDVLSMYGEAGPEISGSVGSASVITVSGAQLMLAQGSAQGNNQYNIEQQDSVAHLVPVCAAIGIWLSGLESISTGNGVGGLEVWKRRLSSFFKARAALTIGMFISMTMRYRWR